MDRAATQAPVDLMENDRLSIERVVELCSMLYPLVKSNFSVPFQVRVLAYMWQNFTHMARTCMPMAMRQEKFSPDVRIFSTTAYMGFMRK